MPGPAPEGQHAGQTEPTTIARMPPRPTIEGRIEAAVVKADQLGLSSPDVIQISAKVTGATDLVELDASPAGIYRPVNFRPAPWSGFAYDEAPNRSIGIAAGTRLLTSRGEVEVESLLPSDNILALRGPALLPLTWIGRTTPDEAPVCIQANALGPNLPRRDLCVAPDQAIFLDAAPVSARMLLNGQTIRQDGEPDVDIFHIDVGVAEILLVEGVPLASGHRLQSAQ